MSIFKKFKMKLATPALPLKKVKVQNIQQFSCEICWFIENESELTYRKIELVLHRVNLWKMLSKRGKVDEIKEEIEYNDNEKDEEELITSQIERRKFGLFMQDIIVNLFPDVDLEERARRADELCNSLGVPADVRRAWNIIY